MPNFEIKVISGASKTQVRKEGDSYKVYVQASPEKGKANKAVIELLSEYFGVKESAIKIIKGLKSRKKTIMMSEYF